MVMFPFVYKLWRYQGLPGLADLGSVFRVAAAPPVPPILNANAADAALADERALRAEFLRAGQEPFLPRLWGSRSVSFEAAPLKILAVDDGSDAAASALTAARFLADAWECASFESPVLDSADKAVVLASREGADWIVAGLPSAAALAKSSDRPVISVPGPSFERGVRRILIPVDDTAASLPAVAEGVAWAKKFGCELLMLHVREHGGAEEHRGLLDLLQAARWDSVAHENVEGGGGVSEAILSCAEEKAADLILMATHPLTIEGALLPISHTLEVLRGTRVPVMTCAVRAK